MDCPTCGKKSASVFRCNNCGDVRCTVCGNGSVPCNYQSCSCKACGKKTINRIS